ncbi:Halomucin [Frankliniella fusca]|uniref:Halomucin n=1 Tax=Frankliniella fusca TaxID=407009 RepID=A0AAE1LG91_9NEOP|nr:Halomucin [Frankliniella fusca]
MSRILSAGYIRRRAWLLARHEIEGDALDQARAPLQNLDDQGVVPVPAPQIVEEPPAEEGSGHDRNSATESDDGDSDSRSAGAECDNNYGESDNNNGGDSDHPSGSDGVSEDSDDVDDDDDDDYDTDDDDDSGHSDNGGSESDEENNLAYRLAKWSIQNYITLEATTALLGILRDAHPELPKTAESLRNTSKRRLIVKEIGNGQYVHFGFGFLFNNVDVTRVGGRVLEVDFGSDGLSTIFKSTGTECWPILARCVAGGVVKPVVVGVFYGHGKPEPLADYLQDLIDDARELSVNGVLIGNVRFQVSIRYFVCDAVARAYFRCCKGHTAINGCEKCEQEGYRVGNITVFQTVSGRLRTDDSFREQSDADHHNGVSPLLDLGIGMVTSFPLDGMHMLDLGVMKRFTEFILVKGNLNIRLSPLNRHLFDTFLIEVGPFLPCEFKRKSRSLQFMCRYKAVEWRLLLLYLGIVIFSRILHPELYKCFLLLHAACFIMNNDFLIHNFLHLSQVYLENFVAFSPQILGPTFVVYNVHNLLHLASDVRLYGNLESFSAYPFENELQYIKKLVKSAPLPLQQICKRLIERNKFNVKRRNKNVRGFQMPHENGPVGNLVNVVRQFRKYESQDFTLRSRRPDNCVTFRNGQIGLIRNIVECVEDGLSSFHVVVRVFSSCESLYDYPLESSLLGIFKVSNLDRNYYVFNFDDIKHKCLLIPTQGSNACIPLLHLLQ